MKKTLNHPKADAEKRCLFQTRIEAYKRQNRAIVYLDESGFSHDMPRRYGYSLKGQRCYGTHDWGGRGRTNVIGALLGNRLLTLSLLEESINSLIFESWVTQDLLPKLPAQSILIMDNATFHKKQSTQQLIADAGHTIEFLPTYSPDLNPIEHKWAQAKAIRRQYQCSIDSLFLLYVT